MSQEQSRTALPGYAVLAVDIVLFALGIAGIIRAAALDGTPGTGGRLIAAFVCLLLGVFTMIGFFIVNPGQAKVLVLFGTYKGTIKTNGFYWANPFLLKRKISLRARNLNGEKLKVNDKLGNPIQIAAVVVWQLEDTYRACFEVDDYEKYMIVQSEAAVRHLAGTYPYDNLDDSDHEKLTLRGGRDQVNAQLEVELRDRVQRAGIKVLEANISHLAYAPEIAEAMLRRQQASAVVAARFQIVNGAVSMVELALQRLSERKVVELDEERKAAMVSNLLVVLCSETAASPVVNAGTLYP